MNQVMERDGGAPGTRDLSKCAPMETERRPHPDPGGGAHRDWGKVQNLQREHVLKRG